MMVGNKFFKSCSTCTIVKCFADPTFVGEPNTSLSPSDLGAANRDAAAAALCFVGDPTFLQSGPAIVATSRLLGAPSSLLLLLLLASELPISC